MEPSVNFPAIVGSDHLQTLRNCGGFYKCPRGSDGRRFGPLVGYAGKYDGPDGKKLQYVGDIYANFAKAEVWPHVLRFFAQNLLSLVETKIGLSKVDCFCGAPIGGYSLTDVLGILSRKKMLKAEKKVVAVATADLREQSEIAFNRHDVEAGERVVIVEDVCNNFSTTYNLIRLIESRGAKVVAIVCLLNRSPNVEDYYWPGRITHSGCSDFDLKDVRYPVISMLRLAIPEYRQDDQFVAADIAAGNVVLKPKVKDDWDRLMRAMDDHPEE